MTGTTNIEELATRESAGIRVSLLWSRGENTLLVVVRDSRTSEQFALSAGPDEAMDVFRHPFAYRASRAAATARAADTEPVATR